jgi:hypothetical protein
MFTPGKLGKKVEIDVVDCRGKKVPK